MQGDVWLLFFSDLKFLNFGERGLLLALVFCVCGLVVVVVCCSILVLVFRFWFRELRSHSYLHLAVIQNVFSYLMLVYLGG
jgi:hypothetical protein